MRRHISLLSTTLLFILGSVFAAAPARAQAAVVTCLDADNEIDVNFNGSPPFNATVKSTVWSECVSVTHPSIVIGVIQPKPGEATGSPAGASIDVADWAIHWYDAGNDKVTESTFDMNYTFTGPLPNLMVSLHTGFPPSSQTGVQVMAGAGSRVCETSTLCTYYNQSIPIVINL